jgi:hypothetical protein
METGIGFPDERLGVTVVRRDEVLIASCRATTEGNTPRLSRRLVSVANKVSTVLSQEHEMGVKWKVQRGYRVSQRRILACLWAA